MSCRKPSKNGKLSLSDTAENKRQDSAGRGKISEAGFSTSDAARSTSSLPSQPQWEAPKHGLPRIAQLDKAKKEGAKYQEQKEKERDQRKASQSQGGKGEKRKNAGRRSVDSTAPELQFSQTLIDSFFEEREPIPPLSDEEKREIYRLVNEYYQEHPPGGSDYLVSGAQVLPGEERKLQTHADSLSGSRRLCGRRKLRSSELPGPDRQRHDLRDLFLRSLPLNPPEQI